MSSCTSAGGGVEATGGLSSGVGGKGTSNNVRGGLVVLYFYICYAVMLNF